MAEQTKGVVIKYDAKDGQEITLTFDTIRKYLVQGHPEYVTPQELMFFMGVCKSQGMNPFKKDCYLIKYSQKDNAAIITAIGFLRSRAKAMPDCKGWQSGIILERKGDVVYSDGLMLDGDKLLGGWAQGKPAHWETPLRKEVNLNGYIKHKSDGGITQFWAKEKQPTQIAKVAEAQLLRTIWPDEFQNIYTDAEISPDDGAPRLPEIPETTGGEASADPDAHQEFDGTVNDLPSDERKKLNEYLKIGAEQFNMTIYEMKDGAVAQWDSFLASFKKWAEKQPPTTDENDEEKGQKFSCPYCSFVSASERGLKKHITQSHPEIGREEGKTPPGIDDQEQKSNEGATETESIADKEDETVLCSRFEDERRLHFCENACRFREGCADLQMYLENSPE